MTLRRILCAFGLAFALVSCGTDAPVSGTTDVPGGTTPLEIQLEPILGIDAVPAASATGTRATRDMQIRTDPSYLHHASAYFDLDNSQAFENPDGASYGLDFTEGLAFVFVDGEDDMATIIDATGDVVATIEGAIDAAPFSDGLAAVQTIDGWGFVDRRGRFAIDPRFQNAAPFRGGYAPVFSADNSWRVIDQDGEFVPDEDTTISSNEYSGLLSVRYDDNPLGLWTGSWPLPIRGQYISPDGSVAFPTPDRGEGMPFSDGLSVASMGNDRWIVLDTSGTQITESFALGFVGQFSEGLARATDSNGMWGYVDASLEFVIEPRFTEAFDFSDGLALAGLPGNKPYSFGAHQELEIIDRTGAQVFPYSFRTRQRGFVQGVLDIEIRDGSNLDYRVSRDGRPLPISRDAVEQLSRGTVSDAPDAVTARATSYLLDSSAYHYGPGSAMDGDPLTAWVEGKDDSGEGEWIEITFSHEQSIAGVIVSPGFFDDRYWEDNNRVARAEIRFAGLTEYIELDVSFADEMVPQIVQFDPVTTTSARIRIGDVYPGSRWDDTPISEVQFISDRGDPIPGDQGTVFERLPAPIGMTTQPIYELDGRREGTLTFGENDTLIAELVSSTGNVQLYDGTWSVYEDEYGFVRIGYTIVSNLSSGGTQVLHEGRLTYRDVIAQSTYQ